ncbi:uncharacterized protein C630.12 [Phoenix dactylifera]|uniref:Uncharacterized protein C630.12 n=1 Tax=Phoenix dactylifera TaxID=42345 RepID=A0A8B7BQW3_PHODC|nr:uncharacterized protein C630.12 [Phoenix dactylifera]
MLVYWQVRNYFYSLFSWKPVLERNARFCSTPQGLQTEGQGEIPSISLVKATMQSLLRLTLFLCCLWALTLLYGEMFAYWIPLWSCSWPQLHPSSSSSSVDNQVKVAVLADPQLMDRTSFRLPSKSFALEIAQFYTDIYMKRSFHASITPFKPDLVVFLGDQFDGGPFLSDQEWRESLSRFRHIYGLNEKGIYSDIPFYYLSGNHDIGYTALHSRHPEVISRYEKEFGGRNYHFSAGKVDFVVVDAQTLDGPKNGKGTSLSWDFIKNISKDGTSNPRVLLTHIPLYRPDGTPCGPYRSSSIINQRLLRVDLNQEIMYQNYLSKETSDHLLDLIRPILVLSGHDHDQCTVMHSTPIGLVTEHTLGTVSWQQGNLYPSFMLLSATSLPSSNTTDSEHAVSTHLCFLPMQTHIYIWYLLQFIMTIFLLTIWPTNGFGCWDFCGKCMSFIGAMVKNLTATSKEKDEEEDCEYEMIWDAEGSMHLVKKTTTKVPVMKSDVGLTARSNVVSRPTAKKHLQEQEASVLVEMKMEAKLDNTSKVPYLGKSKVRKLVQRVFRVVRLVVIIAAVNIPLYVMLLFKDWIDR